MSHYGAYIKETLGKEILENSIGFATYSFLPSGDCYIEDIYVAPDFRKGNHASNLANEIIEIAKHKGSKKLYGSVNTRIKDPTTSLKVLLSYGFKFDSCTSDLIVMVKEI